MRDLIKQIVSSFGYRLVPRDRDAYSLKSTIPVNRIQTVLDVGASVGATVQEWLNVAPNARVYAFEPIPDSFALLQTVVNASGGRAKCWNIALGDSDGTFRMLQHDNQKSASSLLQTTRFCEQELPGTASQTEIEVHVRKLDSVVVEEGLHFDEIVLMKMDVQGFEDRVLAGAANVLPKISYVLSEVSIAPVYQGQCSFESFAELMRSQNYEFCGFLEQFHLPSGTAVYADVLFRNKSLLP